MATDVDAKESNLEQEEAPDYLGEEMVRRDQMWESLSLQEEVRAGQRPWRKRFLIGDPEGRSTR